VVWNRLRGGLEPLDPVTVAVLLAAIFGLDTASGAFSAPASAASEPPSSEPHDPIAVAIFLVAILGSNVGVAASLAPAVGTAQLSRGSLA
jgi:hypothetical protein